MMKLKYHHNPTRWEDGDAMGIASYGVFTVVNDEMFIDEIPLLAYLKDFSDRKGMFEFVFPDEPEYEIDEKILPLVQALQKHGIHTMGSCQGHLEMRDGDKYQRWAYVAFYADSPNVLGGTPEGWEVKPSDHHKMVWKLTIPIEVLDEASLTAVHKLIETATEFYK